jgi:hypothetical protein
MRAQNYDKEALLLTAERDTMVMKINNISHTARINFHNAMLASMRTLRVMAIKGTNFTTNSRHEGIGQILHSALARRAVVLILIHLWQ